MLSSADLHLEGLFFAVLMIFFGAGFLCSLMVFIINSIGNKKEDVLYYLLLFLTSGIIALILVVSYFLYDVD